MVLLESVMFVTLFLMVGFFSRKDGLQWPAKDFLEYLTDGRIPHS